MHFGTVLYTSGKFRLLPQCALYCDMIKCSISFLQQSTKSYNTTM